MERVAPASELGAALAEANWRLLPLAVLFAVANLFAGVARWKFVLQAMRHTVPFGKCFRIVLGVFPLVLLAPSRSNELLRGVALRRSVPLSIGTGSVVVERVLDLLSLLLLVAVGSLAGGWWSLAAVAIAGLLLLALLSFGVAPRLLLNLHGGDGRFRSSLGRFAAAISSALARPGRLGLAFLTSLLAWLLACAMLSALLAVFGSVLPWRVILTGWPVAALAGTLPITLAGMGTRDGAFLLVLAWLGTAPASEAAVLSATLGYAVLGIWLWVLVGIPFMLLLGIESHGTPIDPPPGRSD